MVLDCGFTSPPLGGVDVAATGCGFGTGLPIFFMLAWKFFTVASSAAVSSALAFSSAAFFFSSAAALAAGSGGGGGGILAHAAAQARPRTTATGMARIGYLISRLPEPA